MPKTKSPAPDIQAYSPAEQSKRSALSVIKGGQSGLTPPQQDLMRIFGKHLQQLPRCDWNDPELSAVTHLLRWFFRQRNPSWKKDADDGKYYLSNLPIEDGQRYEYLKTYASSVDIDPDIAAVHVELSTLKQRAVDAATEYENLLRANNLPGERLLNFPVTPLELAAQAGYEENQRERL